MNSTLNGKKHHKRYKTDVSKVKTFLYKVKNNNTKNKQKIINKQTKQKQPKTQHQQSNKQTKQNKNKKQTKI